MPDSVHRLHADAPEAQAAPRLRSALLLRRLLFPWVLRQAHRLRLATPAAPAAPATAVPLGRALTLRLRLARGLSWERRRQAVARLRRLPGFSSAEYRALNPDLGRLVANPAAHALFHGACTGRRLFRPERLARVLGDLRPPALGPAPEDELAALRARAPRVAVYASSHGNVFMQEIADDLAADLAAAGIAVARHDETAPPRPAGLGIFVAPHEFFVLGRGRAWIREDVIARAVMLNTEQVQTRWFAQALPFLLAARGAIDLNAQMSALLAEAGLPSLHLTMAPPAAGACLAAGDRAHPLFRVLPEAARSDPDPATPLAERALDVAYFGAATPRRDAFFARHAGFFAAHECFLYCRPQGHGPIRAAAADGALARLARHVGGHVRITLNLHRDAFGYFEWHRIVRLGMSMGSVVVSEPSLPHPAFRPGTHYFEAPARQIPELIAWLLHDADGRVAASRVQAQARHLLAEEFSPPRTAARVLAFLLDGAA